MSYPEELEEESPGSIDINAGDAAVASQHPVHRGRNLFPVVLSIGVEALLMLYYVSHPVRTHR